MTRTAPDRFGLPSLIVLLVVAFAAGGGGSRYGLANLIVQVTALSVLALRYESVRQFWRDAPRSLRLLVIGSLLVPLIQVIPLPDRVWAGLPGHDFGESAYAAAGGGGWTTWSLNPLRTGLALSALVTPLAVLLSGWTLPRHHLLLVGWIVVLLGAATTLMGVVQLNLAGDNFTLYPSREPGSFLVGTFANRNSTALWLGLCLGLACLLPPPRPNPVMPWVRAGLAALLAVGIVLTKSRTGLVLAALPVGLGALRIVGDLRRSHARDGAPLLVVLGAIALGIVAIGGLFAVAPGRVAETLERFQAKDDPRRFIWDDATFAAGRYWPLGAGIGNFDEVFQVDESLENLTLRTAGRAHNDCLELAIEAGLLGVVLAGLWLVLCLVMAWQARRSQLAWPGWTGGVFLLAIALQSITDYPLRNQTILAFGSFALLLLARTAANRGGERP